MDVLREIWVGHGWCLVGAFTLGVVTLRSRRSARLLAIEARRERRMRMELELYAELEVSMSADVHGGKCAAEATRLLGRRVCLAVTSRSIFSRVAVMLRDAEGRLLCVGRAGIDDLTLAALRAWGQNVMDEERSGRQPDASEKDARSFPISLGEWGDFDMEVGSWALSGRRERRCNRRAMVVPIRAGGCRSRKPRAGQMLGVIVVCTDGAGFEELVLAESLSRALGPMEMLAGRIAATLNNEALTERVAWSEKLAGPGQMAVDGPTHATALLREMTVAGVGRHRERGSGVYKA